LRQAAVPHLFGTVAMRRPPVRRRINSIDNLAGFGGPYLIGWAKEATGSWRLPGMTYGGINAHEMMISDEY
jgi:hypothetical protein